MSAGVLGCLQCRGHATERVYGCVVRAGRALMGRDGPARAGAEPRLEVGKLGHGAHGFSVLPGHVPVARSKPVAPARSTMALTVAKTAPCNAAAVTISPQPRSRSLASGASS